MQATIAEFVAFDGPAFLEVIVDREAGAYPMIPSGKGVRDMITGEWIKSRYPPRVVAVDPHAV
jgi:acetolactate synthase-1/2/3 large subunit